MKILEFVVEDVGVEPFPCVCCRDENSSNVWVKLELFKGFMVELTLCGKCFSVLKKKVEV